MTCFSRLWPEASSVVLPFKLEEDQAEVIGILLSLSRICTHQAQKSIDAPTETHDASHCTQEVQTSPRSCQDAEYLTSRLLAQPWIRNIQLGGIEVRWLYLGEFCGPSVCHLTKIVAQQCDSHHPPRCREDPLTAVAHAAFMAFYLSPALQQVDEGDLVSTLERLREQRTPISV